MGGDAGWNLAGHLSNRALEIFSVPNYVCFSCIYEKCHKYIWSVYRQYLAWSCNFDSIDLFGTAFPNSLLIVKGVE